jgi:hypothetical protein
MYAGPPSVIGRDEGGLDGSEPLARRYGYYILAASPRIEVKSAFFPTITVA